MSVASVQTVIYSIRYSGTNGKYKILSWLSLQLRRINSKECTHYAWCPKWVWRMVNNILKQQPA